MEFQAQLAQIKKKLSAALEEVNEMMGMMEAMKLSKREPNSEPYSSPYHPSEKKEHRRSETPEKSEKPKKKHEETWEEFRAKQAEKVYRNSAGKIIGLTPDERDLIENGVVKENVNSVIAYRWSLKS